MSRPKRRVLFAGAYGIRNAGDDLPLLTLCQGLRERHPGVDFDFVVLSRHPDPWEEAQYGVRIVKNIEYDDPAAASGRWFLGCNPGDDTAALESVKQEIRAADLLVLGAGNALIDQTIDFLRGPIPLMALYGFLATLYRTPVMIYGMSVGPLDSAWGQDLSRGLLEAARVITVRDADSAKLCREQLLLDRPIQQLPDATLTATPASRARAEELLLQEGIALPEKRVIALGLRDLARPCGNQAAKQVELAIDQLIGELGASHFFLFIPQCLYAWGDDRLIAQRLARKYPRDTAAWISGRYHPLDIAAFYRLANMTLAVRLHAAVFSTLAQTPVVAIDYLPKVRGFMGAIGQEHRCIPLDAVSTAVLRDQIQAVLANADAERKRLQARLSPLRDSARNYTNAASRILFNDATTTRNPAP